MSKARIEFAKNYGIKLNKIFNTKMQPIKLYRTMRKLEARAGKVAEQYCNGELLDTQFEAEHGKIMKDLGRVLFQNRIPDVPVFMNLDPRGYALKIGYEYCVNLDIDKDWGGYGILAPEALV